MPWNGGDGGTPSSSSLVVERIGSGNGSGATLIAVATASLPNGAIVFVEREGAAFELVTSPNAALAAAADGITVVVPTSPVGTEVWVRHAGNSRRAAYEASWFLDVAAGDDDNDGITLGTALATIAELSRRLSGQRIPQSTVVTLAAGDYSASPLELDVEIPSGVSLSFQGALTSTADVVAAITATTPGAESTNAGAVRGLVTATAAAFTDRQRLRITSGASSGAIAWVTRVTTPGAGGAANVSRWGLMANPLTSTTVSNQTPAAGAAYALDTIDTTIGLIAIVVSGPGRVVFRDLVVSPSEPAAMRCVGNNFTLNGVLFYGCRLTAASTLLFQSSFCTFALCQLTSAASVVAFAGGVCSVRMCTFTGTAAAPALVVSVQDKAIVQQDSSVVFDNAQLIIQRGGMWDQIGGAGNDAQWCDGTQSHAAEIAQDGTYWAHSSGNRIWGLDNAWTSVSWLVQGVVRYNQIPSVPGGTGNDLTVGSTTAAYAGLPLFDTSGAGSGALMAS